MAEISVKVTTGAKAFSVEGFDEWTGDLKVRLSSPPVKGKANRELVEGLSRVLGKRVELVSGEKSTRKRVRIDGLSPEEIRAALGA